MRYCEAETKLTTTEADTINNLPNTAFSTPSTLRCDLEAETHTQHICFAQGQMAPGTPNKIWWLRWDDEGNRTFTHESQCSVQEEQDDVCSLPENHPGSHDW